MINRKTNFIIHEYTWGCGDFAGFLSSSLILEKICRLNNIEYFIRFGSHPFAGIFNYRKPPFTEQEIESIPCTELFKSILGEKYPLFLYNFLNSFNNDRFQIRLRTNHQFIDPEPGSYSMDSVLTPNQKVLERKKQLLDGINLKQGEYNSLYIGLGGDYPIHKKEDDIQLGKVEGHIRKIIQSEPQKKLLLFSDSVGMKNLLCQRFPEVLKTGAGIIDTGAASSEGSSRFTDTICEFLMIGAGAQIYAYFWPGISFGNFSGFPRWSAIVHGKQFIMLR